MLKYKENLVDKKYLLYSKIQWFLISGLYAYFIFVNLRYINNSITKGNKLMTVQVKNKWGDF